MEKVKKVIFRNIYLYKHINAITINERRSHEFEGGWEGIIYRRIRIEEMEERNVIIL